MNYLKTHTCPRSRKTSIVLGILIAFALVVGGEVYRTNSVAGLAASPVAALGSLALFVIIAAVASVALMLLTNVPSALQRRNLKPAPALFGTTRGMFIMMAVMFVLWLPCLLAYWPGLFSYDIPTQTAYVFTGNWTDQQPPLHTLIWAGVLKLEGVLGLRALTWYALLQMLFLAWSFAYTLRFLARVGTNRVLFALGFVFFALNPVIAIFSIIPVKDALLAGVLCLLSVNMVRLAGNARAFLHRPAACVGLGACALTCCLLRTNMMVAFAVLVVLAIILFKGVRARAAVLFGVPLVLAVIIVGPVYHVAGISAGSSAIASLPFQQVVNVVRTHADDLSAEELQTVENILPVDEAIEDYNPRFADSVVRLFKGKQVGVSALKSQLVDFGMQWLRWGVRYPREYLDTLLALNIPYWYPLASTPDEYSQRAYIETFIWKQSDYYPVQDDSKLPALRGAYEQVANYSALNNPVAGMVFSPAAVIWVLLLATLLLYNSPRKRYALPVLLPLLFWASFMVGPVSNMRYVFPLFCLYPLLLCAALQPTRVFAEDGENEEEEDRANRQDEVQA